MYQKRAATSRGSSSRISHIKTKTPPFSNILYNSPVNYAPSDHKHSAHSLNVKIQPAAVYGAFDRALNHSEEVLNDRRAHGRR